MSSASFRLVLKDEKVNILAANKIVCNDRLAAKNIVTGQFVSPSGFLIDADGNVIIPGNLFVNGEILTISGEATTGCFGLPQYVVNNMSPMNQTFIDTTRWKYLSQLDQNVGTSSTFTFANTTFTPTSNLQITGQQINGTNWNNIYTQSVTTNPADIVSLDASTASAQAELDSYPAGLQTLTATEIDIAKGIDQPVTANSVVEYNSLEITNPIAILQVNSFTYAQQNDIVTETLQNVFEFTPTLSDFTNCSQNSVDQSVYTPYFFAGYYIGSCQLELTNPSFRFSASIPSVGTDTVIGSGKFVGKTSTGGNVTCAGVAEAASAGTPIATFSGRMFVDRLGARLAIATNPDTSVIAATYGDDVRIYNDSLNQQQDLTNHVGRVSAIAIKQTGTEYIASGDENGTIIVWEFTLGSWSVLYTLNGHSAPITSLAFGRATNTELLISGDSQGTVVLWTMATGSSINTVTPTPSISIAGVQLFNLSLVYYTPSAPFRDALPYAYSLEYYTTAALPASTYDSGTQRITETGGPSQFTLYGGAVTPGAGDVILVKNETDKTTNGIYEVINNDGVSVWILERDSRYAATSDFFDGNWVRVISNAGGTAVEDQGGNWCAFVGGAFVLDSPSPNGDIEWRQCASCATDQQLITGVFDSGTGEINFAGSLPDIDGVPSELLSPDNDAPFNTVLVKNITFAGAGEEFGLYKIITNDPGGSQLRRVGDWGSSAQFSTATPNLIYVWSGKSNLNTLWGITVPGGFVLNTDVITVTQQSAEYMTPNQPALVTSVDGTATLYENNLSSVLDTDATESGSVGLTESGFPPVGAGGTVDGGYLGQNLFSAYDNTAVRYYTEYPTTVAVSDTDTLNAAPATTASALAGNYFVESLAVGGLDRAYINYSDFPSTKAYNTFFTAEVPRTFSMPESTLFGANYLLINDELIRMRSNADSSSGAGVSNFAPVDIDIKWCIFVQNQ